jgi:glutaminyl-peptide cyclotransferase
LAIISSQLSIPPTPPHHMKPPLRLLISTLFVALASLLLISCGEETSQQDKEPPQPPARPQVEVPAFNADSAYAYVEKQLSFGPRVPNTQAHVACAEWLIAKLDSFGAKVITQPAVVQAFNGTALNMINIIGAYNPESQRRIMLSAHWDTRPFADEDDERQDEPIPGANDGASGVAVLLEIARQFHLQNPSIGVDIVFWDAEDYGKSEVRDSYCLGSQYWARNKHVPNYEAMWGINLDMVGAANARFTREGQSMQYAPQVVDRVWRAADLLGYQQYFSLERTDGIIDDHVYVSRMGGVPMIDIIDQPTGGQRFFEHWHTHEDDLDAISRETLKAVGQTVLTVVYQL